MRLQDFTIVVSSLIAVVLLNAIDQLGCYWRGGCLEDRAAVFAQAFWIPGMLFYVAFSWLTVFPAILVLRQYMSNPAASLLVSILSSLLVASIFHRPTVDVTFYHTARVLVPWLGIPWFVGGWVASEMWARPSIERKAKSNST